MYSVELPLFILASLQKISYFNSPLLERVHYPITDLSIYTLLILTGILLYAPKSSLFTTILSSKGGGPSILHPQLLRYLTVKTLFSPDDVNCKLYTGCAFPQPLLKKVNREIKWATCFPMSWSSHSVSLTRSWSDFPGSHRQIWRGWRVASPQPIPVAVDDTLSL